MKLIIASNCRQQIQGRSRSAFTLVEMLVAVALISILMLMFAQIFSLASEILSQQRGIAANDQTERQLRTVFRDDLNHRTFKNVLPFESNVSTTANSSRSGYFHISEGSVTDDTDDILQLTVSKGANEDPFYGRAETIAGSTWGTDLNQPEFDDELSDENNVGSSPFGEVAYFLRNGNLYRRLVLIRKPIVSSSVEPNTGATGIPPNLITTPYAGEFWSEFDYSAFYDSVNNHVSFIGVDSMDNAEPDISLPLFNSIPVRLGIPGFRWGFDTASGQPRYKVSDGTNEFFIGRFTQQETSDPDFDYPGANPATNWLDPGTTVSAFDSANGVITDLNGGTRVSEDILLKNVHSFDIKVWDPGVSLGADGAPGVLGYDDNLNATPGPDGQPGVAGFDDDGINGVDDVGELRFLFPGSDDLNIDDAQERGWPGSDDGEWRDLGHSDANGFYQLTATGGSANLGNNNIDFGEFPPSTGDNGNCFDTWHPIGTAGVMPGTSGVAPYRPNLIYLGPDGLPGDAGVDDDGVNGIDDAGELGWPGTDDIFPQALSLIRIHIRYVDQKSDQMRDVIIVHSLTD
ncbi:MAG: type II secretion system protein [Planctomycetaceae bacterium]|nr:type II secretion system protein [Planctomycetaceae bacterium]